MSELAIRHLCEAIRFQTVSHADRSETDWQPFSHFIDFLQRTYPLFHSNTTRTIVADYGLVYVWNGLAKGLPVLLTAHYDVVAASNDGWPHPPFAGHDDGERIHGRGTLDDKGSLIALLEAATGLMETSFTPQHDVYFAFGFDEEQGGRLGAQQIAAYFKKKEIRFSFVLDEGGAVADGAMMGINKPVAVVGIAEKGNSSFRLTFRGAEGHASTPPKSTAIGKMATFINTVETKPAPARLTETVKNMLTAVAPHRQGIEKIVLRKPSLFAPILISILSKNRQTRAMLRTTVAFTMTSAGTGHNVLPRTANCVANVRILHGDSVENVITRFRKIDPELEITPLMANDPTSISATDNDAYRHLTTCIEAVFPDVIPTPYLMVGGTDCRYYNEVADNAYRFLPCRVSEKELATMHGRGESISHNNLVLMIQFYTRFLRDLK